MTYALTFFELEREQSQVLPKNVRVSTLIIVEVLNNGPKCFVIRQKTFRKAVFSESLTFLLISN